LNIKYSTAKTIWKVYATEGRIGKRRRKCIHDNPSMKSILLRNTTNREGINIPGNRESGSTQEVASVSSTDDFWATNLTKIYSSWLEK